MDDTRTKEQEKFPAAAEEAANNNVDGLAGAPIESEAAEYSPETRVTELEAELAEYKDRLLRALDSLPAREAKDERTRSLLAGVEATERELLAVFERHGVRRIDPVGERFDHNFHQAIFEAERPDQPGGSVVEVLQPGYVLHDRLLRPAMVGVAKGGTKPPEAA